MGLHFKLGFDLNKTSDNKYYVNQKITEAPKLVKNQHIWLYFGRVQISYGSGRDCRYSAE